MQHWRSSLGVVGVTRGVTGAGKVPPPSVSTPVIIQMDICRQIDILPSTNSRLSVVVAMTVSHFKSKANCPQHFIKMVIILGWAFLGSFQLNIHTKIVNACSGTKLINQNGRQIVHFT